MYLTLLIIHNVLRWGVLLAGVYAITRAALGVINKRDFTKTDNKAQVFLIMFCHSQALLGLVLYFVSPVITAALNSGEVMKNSGLRFIAVEHIATMLIAIIIIQIGRSLSKKATDAAVKHKRALIWFSIGFLLILSRIPWYAPLFRV